MPVTITPKPASPGSLAGFEIRCTCGWSATSSIRTGAQELAAGHEDWHWKELVRENKEALAYFESLTKMSEQELVDTWHEVTEQDYYYMLECVPPRAMQGGAFACGETMTHHPTLGPLHECGTIVGDRYYLRVAPVLKFNPRAYAAEILNKFGRTK